MRKTSIPGMFLSMTLGYKLCSLMLSSQTITLRSALRGPSKAIQYRNIRSSEFERTISVLMPALREHLIDTTFYGAMACTVSIYCVITSY